MFDYSNGPMKNGTFMSPDYPRSMKLDSSLPACLLYTFVGKKDELVEIILDKFDLSKQYGSEK